MDVRALLRQLVEEGGSDLYFYVGSPPVMRVAGTLRRLNYPDLTPVNAQQLVNGVLTSPQREQFAEKRQLDFAFSYPGVSRFRVSLSLHRKAPAAAFHPIPSDVPSIAGLDLPPAVAELGERRHGLVVVSGPAGSGKSSTLAALIDHINSTRECTITTIEDPIEFIHVHKQALVGQREIGVDVPSFADGLSQLLRQPTDVVYLSHLVDAASATAAIMLAEAGQLVLTSVRTRGAVEAIRRILSLYPAEQERQVRYQLSFALAATVSQELLPRKLEASERSGSVAAFEVLTMTPGIAQLLRDGDFAGIEMQLRDSATDMRASLQASSEAGLIDYEAACAHLGLSSEKHSRVSTAAPAGSGGSPDAV